MKYNEIKELPTEELEEKLGLERENLQKMRVNHAISPIENPKSMTATRKNIARLLTELKKRESATS
jgi:large subunit ribosomal protein L29